MGDRERREINQPVDVLLAPPGTLMSMLYRSKMFLLHTQNICLIAKNLIRIIF